MTTPAVLLFSGIVNRAKAPTSQSFKKFYHWYGLLSFKYFKYQTGSIPETLRIKQITVYLLFIQSLVIKQCNHYPTYFRVDICTPTVQGFTIYSFKFGLSLTFICSLFLAAGQELVRLCLAGVLLTSDLDFSSPGV